ncbi:Crp/Fnr family transcriptional regulator [Salmonella enterica]|nr:Crp/Fnr family transcriptional regulator [Salmonella enterica]
MLIQQPVRPDEVIGRLINRLEPVATNVSPSCGRWLPWKYRGCRQIYLIKRGEVSFVRRSDNLYIVTFFEPSIFGIAEHFHPTEYLYLKIKNEADIMQIDAEKAFSIFDREGLWKDVSNLLAYYLQFLAERDNKLIQQRTYNIIRDFLIELNKLPEEFRNRETISILIESFSTCAVS